MFRSNNTIDDQRQRHTDDAGHSNLDGKPEGYHKYAEIQHQRGVQAKGLALRLVGLKEKYWKSSPFELSGGQKRRAAIAGVLAMRPGVLVLDEPTAGLDPKGRDEILDQIAYLHRQSDMTVILVSHSMEDIAKYADRIIVMNKGQILYNDTPKQVFSHYQELEKIGLAAPQVTYIMHDIREAGFDVGVTATTVEEAADEIMEAVKKRRGIG